jgi:hypothetical protein
MRVISHRVRAASTCQSWSVVLNLPFIAGPTPTIFSAESYTAARLTRSARHMFSICMQVLCTDSMHISHEVACAHPRFAFCSGRPPASNQHTTRTTVSSSHAATSSRVHGTETGLATSVAWQVADGVRRLTKSGHDVPNPYGMIIVCNTTTVGENDIRCARYSRDQIIYADGFVGMQG